MLVTAPLGPVVVLAVLAGTTGCTNAGQSHPQPVPFVVKRDGGFGRYDDVVGTIGIGPVGTIEVTAPFELLDVEPARVKGETTILTVRAWFHGFGTTPSGYLRTSGAPGGNCAREPITGWGPSYPVEHLRLAPGDDPKFVVYAKPRGPGHHAVGGVRVRYRMRGQPDRTAEGAGRELRMVVFDPADPKARTCRPYDGWSRPEPSYPGLTASPATK